MTLSQRIEDEIWKVLKESPKSVKDLYTQSSDGFQYEKVNDLINNIIVGLVDVGYNDEISNDTISYYVHSLI